MYFFISCDYNYNFLWIVIIISKMSVVCNKLCQKVLLGYIKHVPKRMLCVVNGNDFVSLCEMSFFLAIEQSVSQ